MQTPRPFSKSLSFISSQSLWTLFEFVPRSSCVNHRWTKSLYSFLCVFCLFNTYKACVFFSCWEIRYFFYIFLSKFKNRQGNLKTSESYKIYNWNMYIKILQYNGKQSLINVYALTAKLPNSYSATQLLWLIKKISTFNKHYSLMWSWK